LERFDSGGKEIRVEIFGRNSNLGAPSVIVLHGATGVEFANRFIAGLAESISDQGFVVYLVHYFDRTGSRYADDSTISFGFRSALTWPPLRRFKTRALPLPSFSRAGLTKILCATRGMAHRSSSSTEGRTPARLWAKSAASRKRSNAWVVRPMHIYPSEGHIMSLPAYGDVVQRSVAFLQRH
jgi:dienelactone hydrolase